MNRKTEQIIGMLFPVPEEYLPRIFEEGRDVFVKYLGRSHNIRLRPGNKIIFYGSKGLKHIVGEADISEIEFLTPEEVVQKHASRLFISEEELVDYTKSQPSRTPSKPLFVAVLKNIKKYAVPVFYKGQITMTGMYVRKNFYSQILKRAK
jgi:hypothetical protein